MPRRSILFAIAIYGFSSTSALPLFAQVGGIPSYYGGAPLSPWLTLNNRGGGGVDNYHNFVQPSLQLNNALQSQHMGIQNNAATVNAVGDAIVSQAAAAYAQPMATGQAAGFMNYRHYFNNMGGNGGGAPGATAAPGRGAGGNIGTAPGLNTPNLGGQGGIGGIGRGL
jgi:hypothetical protein